jgi:cytochrome c6
MMKTLKVVLPLILLITLVGTACAAPAAEQEETAPPAEEQVVEESAAEEEPTAEAQTEEETQTEEVQEAEEPSDEEEEEIVQSAIDGAEIYAANCAGCHAPDRSGRNGPPLLPANLTSDPSSYVQLITDGLGGMPGFGNRLSADEINAVVDYILSEPE